jgi:hypothetical protein
MLQLGLSSLVYFRSGLLNRSQSNHKADQIFWLFIAQFIILWTVIYGVRTTFVLILPNHSQYMDLSESFTVNLHHITLFMNLQHWPRPQVPFHELRGQPLRRRVPVGLRPPDEKRGARIPIRTSGNRLRLKPGADPKARPFQRWQKIFLATRNDLSFIHSF